MKNDLEDIKKTIEQSEKLTESEKEALLNSVKSVDKEIAILEFKLERTEKVKRTTSVLLEETIDELEKKRQAIEEKNRELEIETALERVRAKTMAMHKSEELSETASVMFQELKKLKINSIRTGVCIFDFEHDSAELWLATEDGDKTETKVLGKVSGDMHPMYRQWIDAGAKKEKLFQYKISGNEVADYYRIANDRLNLPRQTDYNKSEIYYGFFFDGGSINVIAAEPLTEEELNIGSRFANVFGLLYRRFLDLQKAEAQAREAQIEAALERVRARTMAMQKSEELSETAALLFRELKSLEKIPLRLGIVTYDEEKKAFKNWVTDQNGMQLTNAHYSSIDEPTTYKKIYRAWKENKESLIVDLTGHELEEWLLYVKKELKLYVDESQIKNRRIHYMAFFNYGFLMCSFHEPMDDKFIRLFTRFAKVFDQTYTRFLDLKKAEEQAREAIKQASLDRVRGEIASMRTSEDLNRIPPVIWRELQALEVPFIRCGVFIVNEENEKVQVYLTTPNGKALGVLHLSFDANEIITNTVDYWKKQQIYKTHWDREEFINWTKSMMELGQVQSAETYQGSAEAPESLNLHFVPFRQGMLYVGNVSPLTDEKLDLVKTLAEAFSIAYARYEDFKNLEEAKNKIELTLDELKAAQTQLIQSEKMASLGELTAGIAHEIQNPLNFVNNFSDVSMELLEELKEEIKSGNAEEVDAIVSDVIQNLEKILHHGRRAEGIVKGMLQHSRGSSGQKMSTDINSLADEYLRLSYHGFRAKDKLFNADFNLEADESLPKIEVIPQDIGRVLLNLINNAFYVVNEKAKQKIEEYKPEVIVSTSSSPFGEGEKRGVKITVTDNGPGIPDSIKEKIFQPFFTTKPTGSGTGLGLSLSYDIVKAHGGEITVSSKENEGTEFIIHLPA